MSVGADKDLKQQIKETYEEHFSSIGVPVEHPIYNRPLGYGEAKMITASDAVHLTCITVERPLKKVIKSLLETNRQDMKLLEQKDKKWSKLITDADNR